MVLPQATFAEAAQKYAANPRIDGKPAVVARDEAPGV